MPWSNNSGGPWGGGKNDGGKGSGDRNPWGGGGGGPGGGGGGGGQGPDVDEILRQGRERLKVIFGGGGGGGDRGGRSGGGDGLGRGGIALIILALVGVWAYASFYSVKPEERSVELFLGEEYSIGQPGLNFAPWPVVKAEVIPVAVERIIDIGNPGRSLNREGSRADEGLMLTGDENIVDIEFQVVWNVADPAKFLFNIAEPDQTIRAVSESAMREVIAKSQLKPILNRDRAIISAEVSDLIQSTLDSYDSGVAIVRVNFDRADPPSEVIDAFRDVQAAAQERDTSQSQADAYANQRVAQARGQSAQLLQEAEGYRARVINEAQGEASRFKAIYAEYSQAEDVTRKRLYLETLEQVIGRVDKIIIDEGVTGGGSDGSGQGVVPYLPLNELRRGSSQ